MDLTQLFHAVLAALGGGASAILTITMAVAWWFERKERMTVQDRIEAHMAAARDREREHTADLVRTIEVVNAAVDALDGGA